MNPSGMVFDALLGPVVPADWTFAIAWLRPEAIQRQHKSGDGCERSLPKTRSPAANRRIVGAHPGTLSGRGIVRLANQQRKSHPRERAELLGRGWPFRALRFHI